MSFLAVSSAIAYALLAGVALLIVLLYWLKPIPRRVTVASTVIWRALATAQPLARDRWRWWLSLLLALATGLSIALALTRPQAPALGGVAQRIVLVLDNSPSMAARGGDGTSRWADALERARGVILSAGLASEFMLLDTVGRAATPEWVSRASALANLNRLTVSALGVARMPPIPAGEKISARLFTDGVADLDVLQDVSVESVFVPVDNVAITAFDARPSLRDPTRYQALVQVFNASVGAKKVRLVLTGENGFTLERELDIGAGMTTNQTLDVTGFATGVLRAQVRAQGDGFDLDNLAYSVVASHGAKRVLLVTAGNRDLETSIKLLPGIALTVIKPVQYSAALDFDAYVFDRFAPREAPVRGALLFRPPSAPWLPAFARLANNPVITRWNESHPLAVNVPWRDVRVQRAALATLTAGAAHADVVLAKGSEEGVLVAAAGQAPRWIALGFALDDSNFAMQSGFPVFLGSALGWLAGDAQILTQGLGHLEVPYANARVTGLDGRSITAVNTAGATIFDAAQPDVFTITTNVATSRIVANIIDPRFSDINRSRFGAEPQRVAHSVNAARFGFEPWVALLTIALLLLAFEWLTYTRRVTL